MRDGSDAIADWPILNALVNVAAGATWVSVHHGGGVGIGNSIHAGMVVVADGTDEIAERLERVLTTDPASGVLRHLDAGYVDAIEAAAKQGSSRRCRRAAPSEPGCRVGTAARPRPVAGRHLRRPRGASSRTGARESRGRPRCVPALRGRAHRGRRQDARPEATRRRGCRARRQRALCSPGPRRLSHARMLRRRPGRGVRAPRDRRELRGAARGGSRDPRDGRGDPLGGRPASERQSADTGSGCCGRAPPRSRPNRVTASTATPSSRPCGRSWPRVASRRGSARTPSRRSSTTPRPISTALAESPEAALIAEMADVFLERGAFTAEQARRYLVACRRAGLGLRLHGDQFTGRRCGAGRRVKPGQSITSKQPAPRVSASSPKARWSACCCASALVLGRPMPPARALVDARRGSRPRHRLQPRERILREPALSARCVHAAQAVPGRGARRVHRQCGPRPPAGGSNRKARSRVPR